jgi:regulator of ribonuclease activity A
VLSTADLYDEHGESLQSCALPFRNLGGRAQFRGALTTVRCHEDNVLLKEVLGEAGRGRVLVVDGGGSLRTALVGDLVAGIGVSNGWEGLVIHGAVRDSVALGTLPIGVKALGTNPRKSAKTGAGERDVVVAFGDAVFTPGRELVSDEDGIVVLP